MASCGGLDVVVLMDVDNYLMKADLLMAVLRCNEDRQVCFVSEKTMEKCFMLASHFAKSLALVKRLPPKILPRRLSTWRCHSN